MSDLQGEPPAEARPDSSHGAHTRTGTGGKTDTDANALTAWLVKPFGKWALVGVVFLVLLVPQGLVRGQIAEREGYHDTAIAGIGAEWGPAQTVVGPVLSVPWTLTRAADGTYIRHARLARFLPRDHRVEVKVRPEIRRRGIFEAVVYTADLEITATFDPPALAAWGETGGTVDWDRAHLALGLGAQHGVDAVTATLVAGAGAGKGVGEEGATSAADARPLSVGAPAGTSPNVGRGLEAALPPGWHQDGPFRVRLRLTLRGSDALAVVPLGGESRVEMAADWPDPAFGGNRLPVERQVTDAGFRAVWRASHLSQPVPLAWDEGADVAVWKRLHAAGVGTRFLPPVDTYRKTERAVKYAALFVGLTFALLLVFEHVLGRALHPVQYGLVGLALTVFYLLLLSLAEVIGFGPAYLLAAAAVVAQVAAYCGAILRSWRPAAVLGAVMAGLYAGLHSLLQVEERALLGGTLVLFAVLSLLMMATRNLAGGPEEQAAER